MAPRPSLERLICRPDASDWSDDELVSLAEAEALFFPFGPMTANSLRIAYHRGELPGVEICNKIFTTPRDIRELKNPKRREPKATKPEPGASDPAPLPARLRRRIMASRARRGQ